MVERYEDENGEEIFPLPFSQGTYITKPLLRKFGVAPSRMESLITCPDTQHFPMNLCFDKGATVSALFTYTLKDVYGTGHIGFTLTKEQLAELPIEGEMANG